MFGTVPGRNPVSVHLSAGVIRFQFIFPRNPVSRVIRCRFIFSGKNNELTSDFYEDRFTLVVLNPRSRYPVSVHLFGQE